MTRYALTDQKGREVIREVIAVVEEQVIGLR